MVPALVLVYLFGLFLAVASAQLGQRTLKTPRLGFREQLTPTTAQPITFNQPLFINIPIDHFSENTTSRGPGETFRNRYWLNDSYYDGGPVFIFDSGEQDAAPLLPYYLQEFHGLSAVMQLAKRYKGIAVLWEHRFYGESLPFPVNKDTAADQWKFLTTEQALEDVIFFANSFSRPSTHSQGPQGLAIHPSSTPWIFLGGSYPGIRGALLRQRNPNTIFAAWASSAPVQAQVDMSSYYQAAERSLTRNCSADWVAVTRFVDRTLKGNNHTAQTDMKFKLLKARLSGPGGNTTGADGLTPSIAEKTSNLDAATILLDPLDFYQYYGFEDSVLPFCDLLETRNSTKPASKLGIAASSTVEAAFDAFLVALGEIDYDSIETPDDPAGDRSWMWQYCSEYGFYQRGDPSNSLSIETSFLSLDLFQQQCNEAFPVGLPPSPNVRNVNKYGGWNMSPSNVMFTNGEFDPWRTMGLASIEKNSPHRAPSLDIPRCNTPTPSNSFFGLTYPGLVHVSDMRVLLTPDSNHSNFQTIGFYSPIPQGHEAFYTGLEHFQMALDEWLPCF